MGDLYSVSNYPSLKIACKKESQIVQSHWLETFNDGYLLNLKMVHWVGNTGSLAADAHWWQCSISRENRGNGNGMTLGSWTILKRWK